MNKPIAPPTVGNLERSDNLVRGSSSRYETGNSQYPDNSSHIRGDKSYSRNYSGNSNSKPRTEGYEGLSRRAKAGTLRLDDDGKLNLVIRNNQVNVISTGMGYLEGLSDRPVKKISKKKKQLLRPVQRPVPGDPYRLNREKGSNSKSRSKSSNNQSQMTRSPHESATAKEAHLRVD